MTKAHVSNNLHTMVRFAPILFYHPCAALAGWYQGAWRASNGVLDERNVSS
jgi:hypothetical protein